MTSQSPVTSTTRVSIQRQASGSKFRGADALAMRIAVTAVFLFVGLMIFGIV
ncbi:hypothetical protein JJB09_10630 [Rhizobium sp. KVB221]|uniref:Uncharacterized protein n=1 Tax=Rhizobium setariae TaxID=2801340 RepID=A0A936YQQ6_9HYPH|nr:hypothetical protein [Rhizobium setariae]MBL0372484.1 hypothetical protein [Rhizobium setariae]